jgi:putative pyrroloquinoline-quinone binding quinoprotein
VNILKYAALGLSVMLTSCGGGGSSTGGADSGGDSRQDISISLYPADFSKSLIKGLSVDLRLGAVADLEPGVTLSGTVYVLIVDKKGVIEPDVHLTGENGNYSATLVTNPDLSVGDHQGSIDIEACGDPKCVTLYGSAILTYDFKVAPATNLKVLTALSGTSDWQPFNGNSQRTAYVPVTLDASVFSSRWIYSEPATQNELFQSDLIGDGANLATNTTNTVTTDSANKLVVFADGPWLIALKETTGAKVWSRDLDPHGYGNPASPAIANGVIYTTQGTAPSGLSQEGAELATYDETTGAAGFHTNYSSTYCNGCGPAPVTVIGTQAFLEPSQQGYGMSVIAFDTGTGSVSWVSPTGADNDLAYALDGTDVYFADDNMDGLVALDQPTGTMQYSINTVDRLVSLDGAGGAIVYTSGKLGHVDLSTQSVDWTTPGMSQFVIPISSAIGHGALYVGTTELGSPASVVAYSTIDGHKLWSWSAPIADDTTVPLSLIATKNLLFVGTDVETYAIDVKTQAIVWSYPLGGGLSISPSGILYIQGSDHVAAVNLH